MSIIVSESYYRQIIKIMKNKYISYFNLYYFCLKERKKTNIVHSQRKKNESLQFISTS